MAGTFGPQDVNTDAHSANPNTAINLDAFVGYAGVFGGNDYNWGGRWTAVQVPDGATITSATINVNLTSAGGTSVEIRVYAEDTDDAGTILVDARRPNQITPTTAYEVVAANPGTGAEAIPFTGPMQELIDRTGWTWTSGTGAPDVVAVMINQQASGTDYIGVEQLENTGTSPATLTVTYTVAGGSILSHIMAYS